MGLRPAKCYRKLKKPYTRVSQKKPRKSYVVGVPAPKITHFVMGNQKKEFNMHIQLIAEHSVQIRNNALEAMRIAINKEMEKKVGPDGYWLRIRTFPHHVMREHSLATGAGADRFSSGMRASFGNPIGTAAQVHRGQILLDLKADVSKIRETKKALKIAMSKIPTTCKVIVVSQPAAISLEQTVEA
jgi:large subunit ribosomal protein L10e